MIPRPRDTTTDSLRPDRRHPDGRTAPDGLSARAGAGRGMAVRDLLRQTLPRHTLLRHTMSGRALADRLRRHVRGFAQEESGAMMIFALYIFIMIVMVAGIGIDLMRFERDRASLQYTLDRAVLAAADLDQPLPPRSVVEDYFAKAGMADYLTGVTVSEGLGYRAVSATAQARMATHFMHMNGVDSLTAPAAGTAEERIDSVEISLVLDVSGSMNSNSRLHNLKVAAKEFIDTMIENTEVGTISINIIPYATQVSATESFIGHFNLDRIHAYSNCVNFSAADFDDTGISTSVPLRQTMHFDPWNSSDRRDNGTPVVDPVCAHASDSSRHMMVMQNDRARLKAFIDGLYAKGNTSIDVGMKWGAALLDPSLSPVIMDMVEDAEVEATFANRPFDYTEDGVMKVVVLMTDGQNTSQYYVNDGYRRGQSNIWWNAQEQVYSVYVGLDTYDQDGDGVRAEPVFYWPHTDSWQDHAYGGQTYERTETSYECESYRANGSCRSYRTVHTTVTVQEPGTSELLSYPDLWAATPIEANARMNYYPWMNDSDARNDWVYDVRSSVGTTEKNRRADSICAAAKQQGVIIFSIGFEAPYSGREVLRRCASSDAHFFDVAGTAISDAFASIATSIRKLRLTQ